MRLVIQRVLECSVSVEGKEVSRIGKGMLILLGLTKGDDIEVVKKYAAKALKLRLWHEIVKNEGNDCQIEEKEGENSKTIPTIDNSEPKEEEKSPIRERKTWHTNVVDNEFDIMVVSQFTLYGILKGNKPDFHGALNNKEAIILYQAFIEELKKNYKSDKIQMGRFGEYMHVDYINDGPVTIIIDSEKDK